MGSRKSTRSMEAVTTLLREWRKAAIAAHLSIMERITPPNTWPRLFASPGIIISEVSGWLSLTAFAGRISGGLRPPRGGRRAAIGPAAAHLIRVARIALCDRSPH